MNNEINDFLIKIRDSLEIKTVYDIGACRGSWAENIKSNSLPNSEFILFEANPYYKNELDHTGFKNFIQLLSSPDKKILKFYNGTNFGDSYYKETSYAYDNMGSIDLEAKTLDNMIETHNLPLPNFIKLDVQGSELDVLAGAENAVNNADLIYVECPILSLNKGAPNIQQYIDYFKSRQFIPIDIFDIHRPEETLVQIDIMFMRYDTKQRILGANTEHRVFE